MEVVSCAEPDETSFRSQELVIDVRKEHMLSIIQLFDDIVAFFDLATIDIVRTGAAREDSQ